MLLLETAIKCFLVNTYDETNNINESCKITEDSFPNIKVYNEINGEYYKITLYSSINNSIIAIFDDIKIKNN